MLLLVAIADLDIARPALLALAATYLESNTPEDGSPEPSKIAPLLLGMMMNGFTVYQTAHLNTSQEEAFGESLATLPGVYVETLFCGHCYMNAYVARASIETNENGIRRLAVTQRRCYYHTPLSGGEGVQFSFFMWENEATLFGLSPS